MNHAMASIRKALLLCCLVFFCSAVLAQDGSVRFKLTPVPTTAARNGHSEWSASFSEAGKEARFVISVEADLKSPGGKHGIVTGSLRRVAGSQPQVFLQRLSHALGAKGEVPAAQAVDRLPVLLMIQGTDLSRASRGGFTDQPAGDWIAMKLFLEDGKAEVYLNLNPKQGVGEFSVKDDGYAHRVLRGLASVL